MENDKKNVQIITMDGFYAVYVDEEFYKDLVICDLDEIIAILENIKTKEEILNVIKELVARLETRKDNKKVASVLWEFNNFIMNDKLVRTISGEQVAKHVITKIKDDEEVSDALREPNACRVGDFGVGKYLAEAPADIGNTATEQAEIEVIIKERKLEEINKQFFDKEEKDSKPKKKQKNRFQKLISNLLPNT